ncbi:uncharacterized mitochondrial protein-like protein [Tanacetum coccineum]|uniref:Uncharacterized mitochondrial protein-like protein n=1 Tax=Tanacetum coccineum TaxID=301880 RepID=A0ABQ5GF04_9ASTR
MGKSNRDKKGRVVHWMFNTSNALISCDGLGDYDWSDQAEEGLQLVWVWNQRLKVLDHVSKHNSASMKFKRFDYVDAQGRSKTKGSDCKVVLKALWTGNMSIILLDFEEIDRGYVTFGGNPKKGGKITGRATSDESKLWHRRLGHINFKTMNKLVKGNLVRGLPSKLFENDQTCVACQKGKQHRVLVSPKHFELLDVPNKPNLEDYCYSDDDDDVGAEDDMNNLIHYPDFLNRVYKVEKALYGLHQAPRAWYETLSTYLLDNGFQRGKIDNTLFIRRDKGDILLVQVYVDDIIFGSTKKSLCTEFEKMMHKKFQ